MNSVFRNIDFWNIILMAISLFLAILYPFELFLFSYIILGPLHYLTEIGWLNQRDYFVHNRGLLLPILVVSAIVILISIYLGLADLGFFQVDDVNTLNALFATGIWVLLLVSIAVHYAKSSLKLWLMAVIGLGLGLFFSQNIWFVIILGVFIPTLIHTTFFTGGFMLEGAMKSGKSITYAAFSFFVFCNIIFFIYPNITPRLLTNPTTQNVFLEGDFFYMNLNFYNLFYGESNGPFVLDSSIGTRIQGFIAFAYTYHYLNWFSKTEIIKWHKIPKRWLIISAIVWLVSIAIHLINVKLGILCIASLSLLHVYLEFPLNSKSFANIYEMTRRKLL